MIAHPRGGPVQDPVLTMFLVLILPGHVLDSVQTLPGLVNYRGTEMCSGSEEGSYLRLIDFCITQL